MSREIKEKLKGQEGREREGKWIKRKGKEKKPGRELRRRKGKERKRRNESN